MCLGCEMEILWNQIVVIIIQKKKKNSYITAHLDSWTEYSEENKKYNQTSVHTKVLEAMFPKQKKKSKTVSFAQTT